MNAAAWQSAHWALEKGLYNTLHDTVEELDKSVNDLATSLAASNPEAMSMLKKVFWEGTENWDTLLLERALMSGTLVLSDFTRNAISKFKTGER
jgi:methylglutaconyl-CoA hydratase